MINFRRVRFWRRLYISFSIFLGLFTPIYCWILLGDIFDPFVDPISRFGIEESTSFIWDLTIFCTSISIFLNSYHAIKYRFRKKVVLVFLILLVLISSVSLFCVALIPLDRDQSMHYWFAFTYFAIYNFYVFIFGLIQMYKDVKKGFFSVFIGSLMLFSSLLILPFQGLGIFEIVYVFLVIFWNTVIFLKRIRKMG